jgi:hypothetical protein
MPAPMRPWRPRWLPLIALALTLATAVPAMGAQTLVAARLFASASVWLPRLLTGAPFPFEERLVGVPGGTYADCAHGDKVEVGESLTIDRNAWVCGNVTVYNGNVTVSGRLDGEVRALAGSVTVLGEVHGGVTALGGQVELGTASHVTGDVQVIGGNINRAAGAQVDGRISREADLAPLLGTTGRDLLGRTTFSWWLLIFWALAGALFALVLPKRLDRIRGMLFAQVAPNFLMGFVTLVLGVLLIALLTITFIGLALAVPLAIALWIAWVFGTVAVGYWLGHALLRWRKTPNPVISAALGVTLLGALEQLPYIGLPLALLAGAIGLGATLRLAFFSRIPRLVRA